MLILSCIFVFLVLFAEGETFKVYFEHEDSWQDTDDLLSRDARYQKFQLIFPGTKWCGTGSIAENNDDLGPDKETDMCCREHDLCPNIIESGDTKYNLTNQSFYTKLVCDCDEKFYDCLKGNDKKMSNIVGTIYFSVLGTQCFRKDYPIIKCAKYHHFLKHRCVAYEFDEASPQIYEWFDVPPY